MKIEGADLRNFQPRHIDVARRQSAESVRGPVFPELDEAVAKALVQSDVVNLSPEAKALLKKLRAEAKDAKTKAEDDGKELYTRKDLEQKKEDQEGDQDAKGRKSRGLTLPPAYFFQLTGPEQDPHRKRARQTATGHLIEKMVAVTPGREPVQRLKEDLDCLGEQMVETVRKFGVRIIIMDRQQTMGQIKLNGMFLVYQGEKTFDGRDWNGVRGLYNQSNKLMVVGEETIGRRSHSAPRHEFAHAYDHTFSERHQRKLPLSVQLWNLFAERRTGVISPYASTNPAEYFAECVEAYFQPNLRERLAELDPQMEEYLNTLFAA